MGTPFTQKVKSNLRGVPASLAGWDDHSFTHPSLMQEDMSKSDECQDKGNRCTQGSFHQQDICVCVCVCVCACVCEGALTFKACISLFISVQVQALPSGEINSGMV